MVQCLFTAHQGYAILCVVFAVLWGVFSVLRDAWIMKSADAWRSAAEKSGSGQHNRWSIGLEYAYLVAVCCVLGFITRGCVFALNSQLASKLFATMTHAVLHSSMTLFYHTPIGETLNRYYSDMHKVDEFLFRELSLLVLGIVSFLTRVVVVGWVLGPVGVIVLIVGYICGTLSISVSFYVKTTVLLLSTKAKMLNLVAEVVDGENVIRAFGNQQALHVFRALDRVNDMYHRASYLMTVFNSSVVLHSDLVIAALILALLAVVATQDILLSDYGLVLLYIFSLQQEVIATFGTGLVNTVISFYCVERLREYGNLPTEANDDAADLLVSSHGVDWPQHGNVTFEHVYFSYPSPKPNDMIDAVALHNVSFSIRGGEKVGIIGRTGSGKSSLAMALLRVHSLRSGRILLDGVDLRKVSLTQLRRSFTMIPQSPTFYRCSIRDYLDPFHEFDDAQLWRELLTVELGSRVQSLDEELLDNGENWSLGQRQLLCFARALLKPSRVVILDEAFSCIDQSCQEKILKIVRERMSKSTVILITHRLDQILAFDQILVMSKGQLVENGSASELASDPGSLFYEFLETSLLTM